MKKLGFEQLLFHNSLLALKFVVHNCKAESFVRSLIDAVFVILTLQPSGYGIKNDAICFKPNFVYGFQHTSCYTIGMSLEVTMSLLHNGI
jgi:hypothetical protein